MHRPKYIAVSAGGQGRNCLPSSLTDLGKIILSRKYLAAKGSKKAAEKAATRKYLGKTKIFLAAIKKLGQN